MSHGSSRACGILQAGGFNLWGTLEDTDLFESLKATDMPLPEMDRCIKNFHEVQIKNSSNPLLTIFKGTIQLPFFLEYNVPSVPWPMRPCPVISPPYSLRSRLFGPLMT